MMFLIPINELNVDGKNEQYCIDGSSSLEADTGGPAIGMSHCSNFAGVLRANTPNDVRRVRRWCHP